MLKRLLIADRCIAWVIEGLVAALLAAAAGLGAYQVLTRFVLHQPASWTEALTRVLLVWMVCLGAALAVRAGGWSPSMRCDPSVEGALESVFNC